MMVLAVIKIFPLLQFAISSSRSLWLLFSVFWFEIAPFYAEESSQTGCPQCGAAAPGFVLRLPVRLGQQFVQKCGSASLYQ